MGHYRSELISDEQAQIEAQKREDRLKARSEGASALKELFGDKAGAVAYFLHEVTKGREPTPQDLQARIDIWSSKKAPSQHTPK